MLYLQKLLMNKINIINEIKKKKKMSKIANEYLNLPSHIKYARFNSSCVLILHHLKR